jgi:6-phosphogluconolactonase
MLPLARRSFLLSLGILLLMSLSNDSSIVQLSAAEPATAGQLDVWIGTSQRKPSEGIYHCTLDTKNGKLSEPQLAAKISGPGFLALHPDGHHLYAVAKLDDVPSVVSYHVVPGNTSPSLEFDNALPIADGTAAHVAVEPTGRTLLTAQYGGGSVAAFSLNRDGSLKEATNMIKHKGGSRAVPGRQDSPHAHWVGFSPDNRFAFVPDLGLDKVVIYKLNPETAELTPHGYGKVPAGGGPRHMKFHPNGKIIYVLNELSLSVTVFDYDAETGTMTAKQTIPTIDQALLTKELFKSASEIRVHPSGKFVYSANRGHDTITAFRVNEANGKLTVIEVEPVRGATPRNFNLDPSGRWLLAAGQDSHTLASFAVDGETGELTYNRSNVTAPSAICILFQHE